MKAADFSQMSIYTRMYQILGRQIRDDTTAIKKSKERNFLKIFLLSAALAGEF